MKLFENKVKLQPQFIANLLFVVCMVTLKIFYVLFINLACQALQFKDAFVFARIGQSSNKDFLIKLFCKNGYLKNLSTNVLKSFLGNVHLVKENIPTVEKNYLLLVLPYLGIISLETRIKPQRALRGVLNCYKLNIAFKYQARLSNSSLYKDAIPKDLISGVI